MMSVSSAFTSIKSILILFFLSDWTQSDLACFLATGSPASSALITKDAAQVLHRIMTRLGSFPYHNHPASQHLTVQVLRHAVVTLLRPIKYFTRRIDDKTDEDRSYHKHVTTKLRRIVFQCMAMSNPPENLVDRMQSSNTVARTEDDDEDLLDVLRSLSEGNSFRRPDNPKVKVTGAKIPDAQDLPSSDSQDLDGLVTYEDLQPLIQVVLSTQLYDLGIGPHHLQENMAQLNHVAECVLAAFSNNTADASSRDISWETFNLTIGELMVSLYPFILVYSNQEKPNLLDGLLPLFKPLILSEPAFNSQLSYPSEPDAGTIIPPVSTAMIPSLSLEDGRILNLALLCQIATFLPVVDPSVLYSSDHFDLERVKSYLSGQNGSVIILISGTASNRLSVTEDGQLGLGICIQKLQEKTAAGIFQYEPVHRVFSTTHSNDNINQKHNDMLINYEDKPKLSVAVACKDGGGATLILNADSQAGELAAPDQSGGLNSKTVSQILFNIKCIEVVRVGENDALNK
jgi:hypothetical protein